MTNLDKRIRVNGNRSRTGCLTCKIRRVKCDEAKPACVRCSSTGRTCDGYNKQSPQPIEIHNCPKIAPKLAHVPLPRTQFDTHRPLHYYFHRCLETVSAGPYGDKIRPCLVQFAIQEEAVYTAMLSFGALHEALLSGSRPGLRRLSTSCLAPRNDQATHTYCHAIQLLNGVIKTRGRAAVPVVLVCCLLFACFELLHGRYKVAVGHVEAGLDIISELQRGIPASSNGDQDDIVHESIATPIVFAFYRLSIAAYFAGSPDRLMRANSTPETIMVLPFYDGSHDEISKSLMVLTGDAMRFLLSVGERRFSRSVTPDDYHARDLLISAMAVWYETFQAIRDRQDGSQGQNRTTYILLESQHKALSVMLGTSLDADEVAFDAYFDHFRDILALCQAYADGVERLREGSGDLLTTFTVDMGILPQLWLVLLKCRHLSYRQQALSLLRRYHCREGTWDPMVLHRIGQRIIQLEHRSTQKSTGTSGEISVPDEFDRLWSVTWQTGDAEGRTATFAYKPAELAGQGVAWKETI